MKSKKTISSPYIDNNNPYQGLIKKLWIIRSLRPIKDQQIVIDQQPDPSPTVIQASGIILMPREDDMDKNIIPITKPGPLDIFVLKKK